MRVTLAIESLKCTAGSSNKGYQLIKVFVEGELKRMIRVYGGLDNPNQFQITGEELTSVGIEDDYFKMLKSKLKKYNRHSPADDFEWNGSESDWLKEGHDFVRDTLRDHGPWERSFSSDFECKIDTMVERIRSLFINHADTDVEDLFRTTKQREQREQEKAEAQSLDNWGAF